jgi:hypothetical protein
LIRAGEERGAGAEIKGQRAEELRIATARHASKARQAGAMRNPFGGSSKPAPLGLAILLGRSIRSSQNQARKICQLLEKIGDLG